MKPADQKLAQPAGRKKRDEQPLKTDSDVMPGLTPQSELKSTKYMKGIVHLSSFHGIGAPQTDLPMPDPKRDRFGLMYQGMNELVDDHGMAVISEVLIDAGLWTLRPEQRLSMIEEIKANVHKNVWPMIEKRLQPPAAEEGEEDNRDPLIVALWAEVFAEPLSDVWLAAMAQHAYWIEGNEFAFGYLTAQLDRRGDTESAFVRGRKIVESSKIGGEVRARSSRTATNAVLESMRRLIAEGHSVSRSAGLAAKSGIGSSLEANRRLWNRRNKS